MLTLTSQNTSPFGQVVGTAGAEAAVVFVRERLDKVPATTPVQLQDTGGGTFAAVVGNAQFSANEVAEFRQAVDTLRGALGQHGVTRARLDELNAFPDLELSETAGQLRAQIDNLLRIFGQVVKGIVPGPSRPAALPIAGSIFLGLLVIGTGVYLWMRRA